MIILIYFLFVCVCVCVEGGGGGMGVGREDEDKRKTRKCSNFFFFFKIVLFWHILEKSSQWLFSAWSFPLIHIWFTPSEGPKGFVNDFVMKSDHGSWAMKSDHGKGLLSWSNFMVHGAKHPLICNKTLTTLDSILNTLNTNAYTKYQ